MSPFNQKHKERADRANKVAQYEKERAERIVQILKEVDNVILDNVAMLPAPAEFFDKIQYLQHKMLDSRLFEGRLVVDPRGLAEFVVKELDVYFKRTSNLQNELDQIRQDINVSKSQKHRGDSRDIQDNQGKIAGPNSPPSNEVLDLVRQLSLAEAEKDVLEMEKLTVEADQHAAKRTHEDEIENLQAVHRKAMDGLQRDNESARNILMANHTAEKEKALDDCHAWYTTEKIKTQAVCDSNLKKIQEQSDYNMKRLTNQHDRERSDLQARHNAENSRQSLAITTFQKEANSLKTRISDVLYQHQIEQKRLREDHELVRRSLDEEMSAMQKNHSWATIQMEQKHRNIMENHTSEMEQLEQEHESEESRWLAAKSEMQRDYDSKQEEHHSAVAQLNQEHDSTIDQMKQKHESVIAHMRQVHENERVQLISQMTKKEKEYASENEKLRENLGVKILQLEDDFDMKAVQLEMAHAEERQRLRKDVAAYSAALLARDDFEPMPDNKIADRFQNLVQDVDTLARLEWRVDQEPWTSQVLQRLSSSQRVLKRQIVQDSIWIILHDHIFCSPFRIFGEEGRSLEKQWNKECGAGLLPSTLTCLLSEALISADPQLDNGCYAWPKPMMKTERWRYVTTKECHSALQQPLPSAWDPRARLKKGFKTSISALREELKSALNEFANLDHNSIQAMEKITLSAANMWLEFGMQRCRITVVVQRLNLKSAEERVRRVQENTLKLVVVPELRRFGNSKGQDLNIKDIIGGCDGETVELSMQR